jgi:hypothetical protein
MDMPSLTAFIMLGATIRAAIARMDGLPIKHNAIESL